jgi:hypothetical protein
LLYLPLDKLIQMTGQVAEDAASVPAAVTPLAAHTTGPLPAAPSESRTRDAARTRTRETR